MRARWGGGLDLPLTCYFLLNFVVFERARDLGFEPGMVYLLFSFEFCACDLYAALHPPYYTSRLCEVLAIFF